MKRCSTVAASALFLLLFGVECLAQRAGQTVIVRTGSVVEVKAIDLNDGNAVAGALVGGAFGAALTRSSKSSSTRGRNAAIGAVLGGVVAASSRRPGRLYSVAVNDGTIIKIATEQTEIRVDDCVYVEEARGSANIRRAPGAACSPASQTLIAEQEIQDELHNEADVCAAAKQELVVADDDKAVDRAVRKVQLLCYS